MARPQPSTYFRDTQQQHAMEDAELESLLQQFAQVQTQDAVHRLSERNCVEIILKLIQTQRVELIYTRDGKEYLTPKQLRNEIEDEVLAAGGRIGVVELQPLINVDMQHIENKVNEMCSKGGKKQLINGQIITDYYLDSIMEEVNELLQASGQLNITSLAQRFSLPATLIRNALSARLGTQVQGTLREGILYTETFVFQHNARVRAAFSAITKPTTLRAVQTHFNFLPTLLYTEVKRLVDEGELPGSLSGSEARATYIPYVFSHNQQQGIKSFFQDNGYIEYSALKKFAIGNPQKYMQSHFPEDMALASCYLSNLLKENVLASLEELTDGWVDIQPLLPPPLTLDDVSIVLNSCLETLNKGVEKESAALAMERQYVVTSDFIEKCSELVKPVVHQLATTAAQSSSSKDREAAVQDDDDEEEDDGGKRGKGKKSVKKTASKKKKGRRNDDSDDDDDVAAGPLPNVAEESSLLSKKEKRKAKAAAKMGNKSGSSKDVADKGGAKKPIGGAAAAKRGSSKQMKALPLSVIIDTLTKHMSEVPEELLGAIARHIAPQLQSFFKECQKSLFTGGASDRRKAHELRTAALQDLCDHVHLFYGAAQQYKVTADDGDSLALPGSKKGPSKAADDSTGSLLEQHLLKTLGVQALDILLENEAMHHDIKIHEASQPEEKKGEASSPIVLTPQQRTAVLHGIPAERAHHLKQLQSSLGQKHADVFVDTLPAVAASCEMRIKAFDRKKERAMVFNIRRGMMAKLEREEHPQLILQYTVLVLHSQIKHTMLHAPSRVTGAILESLVDHIEAPLYEDLTRFSTLVEAYMTRLMENQNNPNMGVSDDEQKELKELTEKVRRVGMAPKIALTPASRSTATPVPTPSNSTGSAISDPASTYVNNNEKE